MKIDNLTTISSLVDFLDGNQPVAFSISSKKQDKYKAISKILSRFNYPQLNRKEKGIVIQFLLKISGYSKQQLERLIRAHKKNGNLVPKQKTVNGFERKYFSKDITLLADLDKAHDTPNGLMVKKICERAFNVYGDISYERLQNISVAHIYNLRKSKTYQNTRRNYEKTNSKKGVQIGERKKPINNGKPGYIRIDTVHQGDLDGKKGLYHINAVDEVTQYQVIATVEKISEIYLLPVLEELLASFPFKILNFHSDNGSEYVNKTVARLLQKLLIEFTKSRPRKSNDNALAEGKNAAVVRKTFGYSHIPQPYAKEVNKFNKEVLNPYINFHRPCLFPTDVVSEKGKVKKVYKYENMMTPYDKLKSVENAQQYLNEGITFKMLDDIAMAMSDNDAALLLQRERAKLFNHIHEGCLNIA